MKHLTTVGLMLLAASSAHAGEPWTWAAPGDCPTEVWELTELWRLTGDDDPLIHGTVAIERDDAGRLYLLNAYLNHVQIYEPDGRFVQTILREGEGPGEVVHPLDMMRTPGGHLCILQAFPSRLVIVDREGNHVDAVSPQKDRDDVDPFGVCLALLQGGPTPLVGVEHRAILGPTTMEAVEVLWSLSADFLYDRKVLEKRVRYELLDYDLKETDVFHPLWGQAAVRADGRLFYAPDWNDYHIVAVGADGEAEDVVSVQGYAPLERPGELSGQIRDDLEHSPLAEGRPPRAVHVEANWPAVISLRLDEHGDLWVLSGRGFRDRRQGEIYSYDVFDAGGAFSRKLSLRGPGWNEYPAVHFLGDDLIALYTQAYDHEGQSGEDGEIIVCKVTRRAS